MHSLQDFIANEEIFVSERLAITSDLFSSILAMPICQPADTMRHDVGVEPSQHGEHGPTRTSTGLSAVYRTSTGLSAVLSPTRNQHASGSGPIRTTTGLSAVSLSPSTNTTSLYPRASGCVLSFLLLFTSQESAAPRALVRDKLSRTNVALYELLDRSAALLAATILWDQTLPAYKMVNHIYTWFFGGLYV